MLEQYQPGRIQGKLNLYLVEPSQKLSYQFATLRNELDRNNILYKTLVGYDEVMELMNDKINKNIIVINSTNIGRSEFPTEIFNVHGNQIYFFPKRYENFGFLATPTNVIDLLMSYAGRASASKSINLRSIKKDLQRFKNRRRFQQIYDKVMIMYPKGYNPQYEQLFNVLRSFKNKVIPISRENEAQQYREEKSLLIMEKQAFESIDKFIIDNRLENSIDLAILGSIKGFNKRKNYAIMTEYPSQIIEYLDQAGLNLLGAKERLSLLTSNTNKNFNKQATGEFQISQGAQPLFSPNMIIQSDKKKLSKRINGVQIANEINKMDIPIQNERKIALNEKQSNEKAQNSQIPLNSKISDGSLSKSKRSVKKVKKVNGNSQASSIKQSISEVPLLNDKNIDSEESTDKISLKNEINFDSNTNVASQKVDGIILMDQNQTHNLVNSLESGQKPIINWYLYPDKNQKSPNINGPLFVIKPQKDKDKVNFQKSIPLENNSLANQSEFNIPFRIAPNRQASSNHINMMSNNFPPASQLPPKYPTSASARPRQSTNAQLIRGCESSAQNLPISSEFEQQRRQQIEIKYNKGNEIRELSDEYHGSNVSFPIEDSSHRMMTNSSSNYIKSDGIVRSQPNRNSGDNLLKPFEIKKSTSYESENGEFNKSNENILSTKTINSNSSKMELQRALYENKFATSTSKPLTPISSGKALPLANTRVVRHYIQMPQTYQQQSIKNITTKRQIQNQPIIIEHNENRNAVIYKPSQGRLYDEIANQKYGSNSGLSDMIQYTPRNLSTNLDNYKSNASTFGNSSNMSSIQTNTQKVINSSNYQAKENTQVYQGKVKNGPSAAAKNYINQFGINEKNYEVITDSTGIKVYKFKESSTNSRNADLVDRYRSPPKTFTIPITQSISSPKGKSVFNWDDYDEHIDEKGRKYYTIKKSNVSTIPTYTNLYSPNNRQSNQQLLQSKSATRIQTKDRGNTSLTTTQNITLQTARLNANFNTPTLNNIYNSYASNTNNNITSENTIRKQILQTTIHTANNLENHNNFLNTERSYNLNTLRPGIQTHTDTYNTTRSSQLYMEETSRLSRDSLLTDSRPSVSKIFNAHLYGESKPYLSISNNPKIQTIEEMMRVNNELKALEVRNNFTHFIIDTSHSLRNAIQQMAEVEDKIVEIDFPQKVFQYMLKKPLPNEFYDLGFIFMSKKNEKQINSNSLVQGYYLVNIDQTNPQIMINNQKKMVYISHIQNIQLVRKLLLAPNIQHYIFYPRDSDADLSKTLNLFPSSKFKKFNYNSRTQLQNLLVMNIKNKGRLIRTLIFVNSRNIHEIAPLMDHNLNHKTFTMICSSRDQIDQNLKVRYNRIIFADNFNFNSYGSVMNLANNTENTNSFNNSLQANLLSRIVKTYSLNEEDLMAHNLENIMTSNKQAKPKIFIQHPHIGVDQEIQKNFPGVYDIKFFKNIKEISEKSRDNYILLHREADNIGVNFERNQGTFILLGGKKGDRIPSGTVSIQTTMQLIKNIL